MDKIELVSQAVISTESKVVCLIAYHCGESVELDWEVEHIDLDSMDREGLILDLDYDLEVELDKDKLWSCSKISDVVEYIKELRGED